MLQFAAVQACYKAASGLSQQPYYALHGRPGHAKIIIASFDTSVRNNFERRRGAAGSDRLFWLGGTLGWLSQPFEDSGKISKIEVKSFRTFE